MKRMVNRGLRVTQQKRLGLWTLVLLSPFLNAEPLAQDQIREGRVIAWDRNAGNCLSCHWMPESELPGNIGPPLIQMQYRFQDRASLRRQIWDPTEANPDTVMPPYGKHGILTDHQIERVIDYLYSI
jgi:sulfur-oxidizing protein SoxX